MKRNGYKNVEDNYYLKRDSEINVKVKFNEKINANTSKDVRLINVYCTKNGTDYVVQAEESKRYDDYTYEYKYLVETEEIFDGDIYVSTNINVLENIVCDNAGNTSLPQDHAGLDRKGSYWQSNYNKNTNKIYIDTKAPKINHFSSDGTVYKVGQTMGWVVTFSEPVSKGIVNVRFHQSQSIQSEASEITSNANKYQSTRSFEHTVKQGENDYRSLCLSDYMDKAGNMLEDNGEWRANNGYVNTQCADTTPPELSIKHEITGNIVNYNFTLNDNSSEWQTNGQLMNKAGVAHNSLTISDITLANGTIISHSEDNNGNLQSLQVLANGDGKQILYIKEGLWEDAVGNKALASQCDVIIDTKAPHIYNIDKSPCNWTNGDVQLTVFAEDDGTEITGYSFDDGGSWQTGNMYTIQKNDTIKVQVKDERNNTANQTIEVDNIDKTNPTLEVSKQENGRESAKIIISSSDNESGIATCSINGIDVTLVNGKYEFTTTQNGTYTVTVQDQAHNATTNTIDITNINTEGIPDATIMYLINGGNYMLNRDSKAILTEKVVVANVSVSRIQYIWTESEEEPQTWQNSGSEPIFETDKDVNKVGTYYLHVKVTDTNGKITTSHSNAFNVEEFPIKVDDSVITKEIDGTNYIILPKETESSELLEKITKISDKYEIQIRDAGGITTITGNIRTGDILYLEGQEQNYKLYKICVLGDINKDGRINIMDIFQINQYRLEKTDFDKEQLMAADVNRDDSRDIMDIFLMNEYRLEIIESF